MQARVRFEDQIKEVEYDGDEGQDTVGQVADSVARREFKFHGNFSFINPDEGTPLPRSMSMYDSPIGDGDTVLLVSVGASA